MHFLQMMIDSSMVNRIHDYKLMKEIYLLLSHTSMVFVSLVCGASLWCMKFDADFHGSQMMCHNDLAVPLSFLLEF